MAIPISYLEVSTFYFPIVYQEFMLPEEACIGRPIVTTTEDGQYVGPYDSDAWRFDITMNISRKCVL
jgi:hypothetical protein